MKQYLNHSCDPTVSLNDEVEDYPLNCILSASAFLSLSLKELYEPVLVERSLV